MILKKKTTMHDKNELEPMASKWVVAYLGKRLPEEHYSLFFCAAFYF
jgi:hypothetical protein